MASCVRNICTKYFQNLTIGFKVTVENIGDIFLRHSVLISTVKRIFRNLKIWRGASVFSLHQGRLNLNRALTAVTKQHEYNVGECQACCGYEICHPYPQVPIVRTYNP